MEKRGPGRPVTTGTTPKRGIRVPDEMWGKVQEQAKEQGVDVTALTRQFYAWYLREPGAKLPKRPEA